MVTENVKIAICIIGQFARFQPWNFKQFTEDKFLFFEYGPLRFSTSSVKEGTHTKRSLTDSFNLTNVKTVQFYTSTHFESNRSTLWQYSGLKWTNIQRMYFMIRMAGIYLTNHVSGIYSHVLRLREDVRVSFDDWVRLVHVKLSCSIYVQNCNSWGGVNLRWQLMKYDTAKQLMTQYLPKLYNTTPTKNPERFESNVMKEAGFSPCRLSHNMAFVVRYVNASFQCVRKLEQNCILSFPFSSCEL
jgi:hypothetical protein